MNNVYIPKTKEEADALIKRLREEIDKEKQKSERKVT
jgi:hypothetical protein